MRVSLLTALLVYLHIKCTLLYAADQLQQLQQPLLDAKRAEAKREEAEREAQKECRQRNEELQEAVTQFTGFTSTAVYSFYLKKTQKQESSRRRRSPPRGRHAFLVLLVSVFYSTKVQHLLALLVQKYKS